MGEMWAHVSSLERGQLVEKYGEYHMPEIETAVTVEVKRHLAIPPAIDSDT
jgi:hypothetical protein